MRYITTLLNLIIVYHCTGYCKSKIGIGIYIVFYIRYLSILQESREIFLVSKASVMFYFTYLPIVFFHNTILQECSMAFSSNILWHSNLTKMVYCVLERGY